MASHLPPPGKKWVFTAFITKGGKRIYAKQFGKRAFRILVDV